MKSYVIVTVLLAACSSSRELTWGDVSSQLAEGYCEALQTCGYLNEQGTEVCIEHSAWHLCDATRTCDETMPKGAQEALDACSSALEQPECVLLGYYQLLPVECAEILEMRPKAGGG